MKRFLTLCLLSSAAALLSGCPGQSNQTSPPVTETVTNQSATNQATDKTAISPPTAETVTSQTADKTVTNSIGMEFILIPSGSFLMGADKNVENAFGNETPQHQVTISQPFYLGKYEVTQREWTAVMGGNPSEFKGESNPVENVSWDNVQTFIQRLNQKEGTNKYRLPTDAEWEYAARARTTSQYSFGDNADSLEQYAWYSRNSGGKTHPVGQKEPNPWGLHDMHGNVWEWGQDWYDKSYYAQSPASDPHGPSEGLIRVLRGGGWLDGARYQRSTYRYGQPPGMRMSYFGFRLAFSPDHP
jgi:formylglycine-generating enzyme required for sulfatase activity